VLAALLMLQELPVSASLLLRSAPNVARQQMAVNTRQQPLRPRGGKGPRILQYLFRGCSSKMLQPSATQIFSGQGRDGSSKRK
jgi:hypothetical protein